MTQCVTIWKYLVEQPHVTEVGGVEPLTELGGEVFGQIGEQASAIGGPRGPTLLEFHDVSPDGPAGPDLDNVYGARRLFATGLDDLAKAGKQAA